MKESETLDKLYLEWSQFTSARTGREAAYRDALWAARPHLPRARQSLIDNVLRNFGDMAEPKGEGA